MKNENANGWSKVLHAGGQDIFIAHGNGTVALWHLREGAVPVLRLTCDAPTAAMAISRGRVWFPEEMAEAHPAIFTYLRARDHAGNIRSEATV